VVQKIQSQVGCRFQWPLSPFMMVPDRSEGTLMSEPSLYSCRTSSIFTIRIRSIIKYAFENFFIILLSCLNIKRLYDHNELDFGTSTQTNMIKLLTGRKLYLKYLNSPTVNQMLLNDNLKVSNNRKIVRGYCLRGHFPDAATLSKLQVTGMNE
jgi:hypothetical protein